MIFRKLKLRAAAIVAGMVSAALATPAHAEWWEAETAHFIVKTRASKEDAREYALEMERFDAALRTLQGMNTIEELGKVNKPVIYRFGRPKDIALMIGSVNSGVAGFFIPRAGGSVGFAPTRDARETTSKRSWQVRGDPRAKLDPRSILLHEYTHYFMMQNFPGAYPRWYVEGFAETMATMRFEEDGSYHIGDPPQYRAYQIFQLKDFPLDEMLDSNYKLTGLDALQHYATGWLLTHYMSFDGERLQQLRGYLAAIAEGEDSLTAAKEHFGDLEALERELQGYKKGPFPGLRLAGTVASDTVKLRQLSDAEEDAIYSEMRLARGVYKKDDAEDVIGDVQKVIAKHGPSVHLLELLGSAQLSADRFDEADATGARMAEMDDSNSVGWLIRSIAGAERADEDPAFAENARKYAAEAASRDRDDPRPLMMYYYTYFKAGQEVPETAIIALEQAFDLAGSDTGFRLLLARQLVMENRMQSARAVLLPIAFQGHKTAEPDDEEDPTLSRILANVLDGNRDQALVMIDKMLDDEDEDEDA